MLENINYSDLTNGFFELFGGINPSIVGGILLIIGAYLMFKGLVYYASILYLTADICWILLSIENKNNIGILLVIVGTVFGLLTFLKMHFNVFSKTINK